MVKADQKLHLGCGLIALPGWINIDLDSPAADQLLDLTEPLPFDDSSVSHIFNEHFIEHITREQAVAFFKECYRVLALQGTIRITTPNLRFLTHAYFSDNQDEWGNLWQPNSRCQLMNEGMRAWGHQFLYDAEELTRVIGEAGFKAIVFQAYRQSADGAFAGLESRPFHNELIVEACKSANVDVNINFSAVTENEAVWNSLSDNGVQVAEQSLIKTELESAARAEFIDIQSARIHELEALVAAQEQAAVKIATESAARAEFIDIQSARIHELEALVAAQEQAAVEIAAESAVRAEFIDIQSARIHDIEAILADQEQKIAMFQSSWCGKIHSFLNRNA